MNKMEYTARVKINLKEVKLIEELLKIEINKNNPMQILSAFFIIFYLSLSTV